MNYYRIVLYGCISTLIACARLNDVPYPPPYYYGTMNAYSQVYSDGINYTNYNASLGEVTVPESYHVGAYHAPIRAKERDKHWVRSQNPQGYTIELADDEKAAHVAKKLYLAPKTERAAEVRYQRDGKEYYKGLYGSYSNQEDAQKALNNLPPDLKQNAGIKNWESIQGTVE